jgi:integrase
MATVTAREIAAWCKRRGTYPCGDNLYLQVSSPARASWLFRFMIDKRPHGMGLGSTRNWTLAQARERAREARQLLDDNIDPLAHRRAARAASTAAASMQKTFDAVAVEYVAKHKVEWSSPRHLAAWKNSLKRYASPIIGGMAVDKITKHHMMQILEPIWTDHHPTARVLRERLERIMGYAIARDYRAAGDNPALWSTLENMLPNIKHEKKQRAAMPFDQVQTFYSELCTQSDAAALALRLLILTAVRPGEILGIARGSHKVPGATWSEFDLDAGLWVIPAQRMKRRKEHTVTLSPTALALLASLPRDGELLFPGLKENSLRKVLAAMGYDAFDVHGFRASMSDWASEETNAEDPVIETSLAHSIGTDARAAYKRGSLVEKRHKLAADWAAYVEAPPVADNITRLDQVIAKEGSWSD